MLNAALSFGYIQEKNMFNEFFHDGSKSLSGVEVR